jgi:SAM-dependent methyltransferase
MLESFLPDQRHSLLDVGCNVGEALRWAHSMGFKHLYGIDINKAAVDTARTRLADIDDNLHLIHGSADEIPLPGESVDLVLCLEVLEHVPEGLRSPAVAEIARVLRPKGRLILSVPHRGFFDFLDPENIRFRIPRIYALVSRIIGGAGREQGYRDEKHGVVWHHHFSLHEVKAILEPEFRISFVRGRGFILFPILTWIQWPFYRRQLHQSPILKAIERIKSLDFTINWPLRCAYDILVVADRVDRS